MFGFVTRRDHRVMMRANNWLPPRWVRIWAMTATRAGNGWLWYAIGICVLLFGDRNRFRVVGSCGLAGGASVLLFMWVKRLTGRKRPCEVEPHRWANLLPPDQFSFPSGHTMTAFAVVLPVAMIYPMTAPALYFFAVSIAISRILLGMHYLSDVVAGAVIGAGLGYVSHLALG